MIHEEYQYLELAKKILASKKRTNRTGINTFSIFGAQMRFSLRDNIIPVLTTKRVFWRAIVEELLWFLSGSSNATELSEKGIHIWDGNSSREFLDKCGFHDREVGDLGMVYGKLWRHWGAKYTNMRDDYTGQGIDQINEVIKKIREDPYDRRLIVSSWDAANDTCVLPPCHVLFQFYVNDGELSCQLYQRSADWFLGVPFNITSYCLLTYMIAHITGLKPGEFIHTFGDLHIYENHVEAMKTQLSREPRSFPTIKINREINNIDDFKYEDFELCNYNPHGKIIAQMAV